MGIMDWFKKKGDMMSASNVLDVLRPLVAAVRVDVNEAAADMSQMSALAAASEHLSDAEVMVVHAFLADPSRHIQGRDLSDAKVMVVIQAVQRWRGRKAKVVEAQKKLYREVGLWSSRPPERTFNEVILPALLSGELVAPTELCFEPAIIASYRVCESVAQQMGDVFGKMTPPEIVQMVADAGDVYK